MNVLSLFDGISCGQVALKQLRIPVNKYYASEIHKPSIYITQKHFPKTKQLGNVEFVNPDILPRIDLLIGGSPCQGFSIGGKQLNFNDPRSRLFFEYVRILKHLRKKNHKLKFFLENVLMKKEFEDVITKYMEVEPIRIDSRVFSPQTRKRLYWTNIPVDEVPTEDHPAVIRDVLDDIPDHVEDGRRFTSNWKYNATGRVFTLDEKAPCIVKIAGKRSVMIATSFKTCRALTPVEVERCFGLPKNYTHGVSMSERYAMMGNGWEVNTIKFLFKNLK